MSSSLEDRIKSHSRAFDGLLSLIPSKYYYDEATQEQWLQKKKSKQEHSEAKRNKLDPSSNGNPNFGSDSSQSGPFTSKQSDEDRSREPSSEALNNQNPKHNTLLETAPDFVPSDLEPEFTSDDEPIFNDDGDDIREREHHLAKEEEPVPEDVAKKDKETRMLHLKERLAAKIGALREKRKAVGTPTAGAPSSREEMIAERKRKASLKREERAKRANTARATVSDSDGNVTDDETEPDQVMFGNIEFKDGSRVTSDLQRLRKAKGHKGKGDRAANKDIKAHLLKIEQQKESRKGKTNEEIEKDEESESWQRALNHAEGVKVKDNEKLLKKALKRKEKQKLRSELQWKERERNVKETIAAKDRVREENLKARKDNKHKSGKKPKLKKFTAFQGKKRKRAGFEGSLKTKQK